jgi:hypothetical protein
VYQHKFHSKPSSHILKTNHVQTTASAGNR